MNKINENVNNMYTCVYIESTNCVKSTKLSKVKPNKK